MNNIAVSARFLNQSITGVQRYAINTIRHMNVHLKIYSNSTKSINPWGRNQINFGNGVNGHFWEQILLPLKIKNNELLWSPSGIGPYFHANHILTITDIASMTNPKWYSTTYSTVYNHLLPAVARKSKKIITISQFSKNDIAEKFNIDKKLIHVTPLAADDMRSFDDVRKSQASEKPKIIPIRPYVLTVGALSGRKNLQFLLDVWRSNEFYYKNYILLIVGGGNKIYNSNFEDFNKKTGDESIIFTGRVSDIELEYLYFNAISFIYPSLFEGFGLPILEAMRFGCPVLSSNTTSMPEVGGNACIYFDPLSRESLDIKLKSILQSDKLRDDMSGAGRERESEFSWKTTASLTDDILLESV